MMRPFVLLTMLLLFQSIVLGQTWSCNEREFGEPFIPFEFAKKTLFFWEPDELPDDEVLVVVDCRYPDDDLEVLHKFKNLKYVQVSFDPYISSCSEVLSKLPSEGIEYLVIVFARDPHPLVKNGIGNTLVSCTSGVLYEGISKFRNLKKVVLEGDFQRLPKSMTRLKHIEHLEIRSTRLAEFPAWIYGMKKLKSLVLSGIGWDQTRDWMDENPSGTFTQIPEIPKGINKLKQLHHLEVWSSRLGDWPITLSRLKHLEQLVIAAPQLKSVGIDQIENDFVLGLIHPVELLNISLPRGSHSITINLHDSIGLKASASEAMVKLIENKTVSKIAINSEALLKNSQIVSALSFSDSVFIRKQPGALRHIRQSKLDLRGQSQILFTGYEELDFVELSSDHVSYSAIWSVDTRLPNFYYLYDYSRIEWRYRSSERVSLNSLDSFLFLHSLDIKSQGSIDFTGISDGHWEFLRYVELRVDSVIGLNRLLAGSPNIEKLSLMAGIEVLFEDSIAFNIPSPHRIVLADAKIDQSFVKWLNSNQSHVVLNLLSCDTTRFNHLLNLGEHVSVEVSFRSLPDGRERLKQLVGKNNWTVRVDRNALNSKSLKKSLKGIRLETY